MKKKASLFFMIGIWGLIMCFSSSQISYSLVDEKSKEEIAQKLIEDVDVEYLMGNIKELTSIKYYGRQTGTRGNELAQEYIVQQFKDIGLEEHEGAPDYLSKYNQTVSLMQKAPVLNILNSNGECVYRGLYLEDFNLSNGIFYRINGNIKSEIVLIKSPEDIVDEKGYYKGKTLCMESKMSREKAVRDIIKRNDIEADAVIELTELEPSYRFKREVSLRPLQNIVSEEELKENEKKTFRGYMGGEMSKFIRDNEKEQYFVKIECEYVFKDVEVANVVGVIPGTDESKKDEYIVITAHFDHVGDNMNGTYNPGATDNATGVTSILEIARVLKENNFKAERPIMFIAFNGEESGVLGSIEFAKSSIIDVKKASMINIDMIAHINDGSMMIGYMNEGKMIEGFKELYEEFGLNVDIQNRFICDEFQFVQEGAETIGMVEIDQKDYHTHRDTIEVVDSEELCNVVKLVLKYIGLNE